VKRPTVYLVSCAGVPNYGDELITSAWLHYLAEVHPTADVVVDCIRPERAEIDLSWIHPRTTFVDTLWTLGLRYYDADPRRVIEAVTARLTHDMTSSGLLRALRRADVVHLVGGGLLNGVYSWTLSLLAAVLAVSGTTGAKSVVTGQGLCPQSPEMVPMVAEMFDRLTVADVRDQESVTLLKARQLAATCDDVFLLPQVRVAGQDHRTPTVMVCAQSEIAPTKELPVTPVDELAEFLICTFAEWGVDSPDIGFIESFPGIDTAVYEVVRTAFPGVRRYSNNELMQHGLPVRAGQTWISTRFHPHLVAAASGLGGIAISVAPSYQDTKHRSLITQGSGWSLVEPIRLPHLPRGGGFTTESLASLRAAKRAVATRIYADI